MVISDIPLSNLVSTRFKCVSPLTFGMNTLLSLVDFGEASLTSIKLYDIELADFLSMTHFSGFRIDRKKLETIDSEKNFEYSTSQSLISLQDYLRLKETDRETATIVLKENEILGDNYNGRVLKNGRLLNSLIYLNPENRIAIFHLLPDDYMVNIDSPVVSDNTLHENMEELHLNVLYMVSVGFRVYLQIEILKTGNSFQLLKNDVPNPTSVFSKTASYTFERSEKKYSSTYFILDHRKILNAKHRCGLFFIEDGEIVDTILNGNEIKKNHPFYESLFLHVLEFKCNSIKNNIIAKYYDSIGKDTISRVIAKHKSYGGSVWPFSTTTSYILFTLVPFEIPDVDFFISIPKSWSILTKKYGILSPIGALSLLFTGTNFCQEIFSVLTSVYFNYLQNLSEEEIEKKLWFCNVYMVVGKLKQYIKKPDEVLFRIRFFDFINLRKPLISLHPNKDKNGPFLTAMNYVNTEKLQPFQRKIFEDYKKITKSQEAISLVTYIGGIIPETCLHIV